MTGETVLAADPVMVLEALRADTATAAVRAWREAGAVPFPLNPETKTPAVKGFCAQPVKDDGGCWPDATADELIDKFKTVAERMAGRGLPRRCPVAVEPARGLGLAVLDLDVDAENGKDGVESWRRAGMPMTVDGAPAWPHRVRSSRGWHLWGLKPDDGDTRRLWKDGGLASGVDFRWSRSFVRVFAHADTGGNRLQPFRPAFWHERWQVLPTGLFAPKRAAPKVARPKLEAPVMPTVTRPRLDRMDALPSHRVPAGWPDLTAPLPASGARDELRKRAFYARTQYGWSETEIADYFEAVSGEPAYDLPRLAAWICRKHPVATVSGKARRAAQ